MNLPKTSLKTDHEKANEMAEVGIEPAPSDTEVAKLLCYAGHHWS